MSLLTDLDTELGVRYHEFAECELARESIAGTTILGLLYFVFSLATPYWREHFSAFSITGVLLLAIGSSRIRVALLILDSPEMAAIWKWWLWILTGACAVLWGTWCGLTILSYGLGWISFLLLLITAGVVSGGMAFLAPHELLCRIYFCAILIPAAVCAFALRTSAGIDTGIVIGLYLAFQLLQASRQARLYWSAARDHAASGSPSPATGESQSSSRGSQPSEIVLPCRDEPRDSARR